LAANLKKVTVPVVSDAECRQSYGSSEIADSMICAGLPGVSRKHYLRWQKSPVKLSGTMTDPTHHKVLCIVLAMDTLANTTQIGFFHRNLIYIECALGVSSHFCC